MEDGSEPKTADRGLQDEVERVRRRLSQGSRGVILPASKFMARWDVATLVALVFTAVVTPVEVAFCNGAGDAGASKLAQAIEPLFVINRLVDLVFIGICVYMICF